jgi:hypothetical protein
VNLLPLGMALTPPSSPWGINFGGGLNSTALIIECRERGMRPDWILFADTGSEIPGTLEHVEHLRQWCAGWADVTTVRWTRQDELGFEPLHKNCLRTNFLPSKAYGNAGCTSKWKVHPMERWRKANGYDKGAFAVGYDAGEFRRITSACKRGDQPEFTAWYPLVAWGIDRAGCQAICDRVGVTVGKSSCFMCPNMKAEEWKWLMENHRDLFDIAVEIERRALAAGNKPQDGRGQFSLQNLQFMADNQQTIDFAALATEDRCHHGGCFT